MSKQVHKWIPIKERDADECSECGMKRVRLPEGCAYYAFNPDGTRISGIVHPRDRTQCRGRK
jgi:hypothetical protein